MTPLRHIDRRWLRRLVLLGIAVPAFFLYLAQMIHQFGRDFYDAWR